MTATVRRRSAESRLRAVRAMSNIFPRSSKWFGMRQELPKKGPRPAWCAAWRRRGPELFFVR